MESFCPKRSYLRPHLAVLWTQCINQVQIYHNMTQYQLGAPSWNRKAFFSLHLHLAERCCKNLPRARGPARCKSGPAITWLVSVTIYCTIFQKQFSNSPLTLPVFTHKIFKKKLAMENADWTNRWTSIEGAWAPWPNMYSYNWLFSWQNKILYGKSSSGLLFTAKMWQETVHLTSPYVDQITYKKIKLQNARC